MEDYVIKHQDSKSGLTVVLKTFILELFKCGLVTLPLC